MRGHLNDLDGIQGTKRVRVALFGLELAQQDIKRIRLLRGKGNARGLPRVATSLCRRTQGNHIHGCECAGEI